MEKRKRTEGGKEERRRGRRRYLYLGSVDAFTKK
jgi:hypothetical protein